MVYSVNTILIGSENDSIRKYMYSLYRFLKVLKCSNGIFLVLKCILSCVIL